MNIGTSAISQKLFLYAKCDSLAIFVDMLCCIHNSRPYKTIKLFFQPNTRNGYQGRTRKNELYSKQSSVKTQKSNEIEEDTRKGFS